MPAHVSTCEYFLPSFACKISVDAVHYRGWRDFFVCRYFWVACSFLDPDPDPLGSALIMGRLDPDPGGQY